MNFTLLVVFVNHEFFHIGLKRCIQKNYESNNPDKFSTSRIDHFIFYVAGGGGFGTQVFSLPNGNIVVTDPGYDITTPAPIQNVGAVYLYNATGALISQLTSSKANDNIGSNGGLDAVTILNNGNFIVSSWIWTTVR